MAFVPGTTGAVAAILEATKASGVLVQLEPEAFREVLARTEAPLIVTTQGGRFKTRHEYLTSYKGFAFYTKSDEPLSLPQEAEIVHAKKIWIPG